MSDPHSFPLKNVTEIMGGMAWKIDGDFKGNVKLELRMSRRNISPLIVIIPKCAVRWLAFPQGIEKWSTELNSSPYLLLLPQKVWMWPYMEIGSLQM